ncbi:MAG: tRNA (uracil-5-)-methyltransferase, partial [Chthoniobacterales bacterium]
LDPPSEGLAELATQTILERPPARIVYASCNPATLARDARRLAERYTLLQVTPLDMFPQTAEIESVSVFQLIP